MQTWGRSLESIVLRKGIPDTESTENNNDYPPTHLHLRYCFARHGAGFATTVVNNPSKAIVVRLYRRFRSVYDKRGITTAMTIDIRMVFVPCDEGGRKATLSGPS